MPVQREDSLLCMARSCLQRSPPTHSGGPNCSSREERTIAVLSVTLSSHFEQSRFFIIVMHCASGLASRIPAPHCQPTCCSMASTSLSGGIPQRRNQRPEPMASSLKSLKGKCLVAESLALLTSTRGGILQTLLRFNTSKRCAAVLNLNQSNMATTSEH